MLSYDGEFIADSKALVELKNGKQEVREVTLSIYGKHREWSEPRCDIYSEWMSEYEFEEDSLELYPGENDEDIIKLVKLEKDIYDIDWIKCNVD